MYGIETQQTDERKRDEMRARALREGLDQVIDAHLVRQEADRKGVKASDSEVDGALDSVAKQNGLSRAQLFAEIDKMGIKEADYRAELANQILQMRLVTLLGIKIETPETYERTRKDWLQRLRKAAYIEVRL
jgi:peptidyl-prolyl cis-trans isomerase SurA